MGIPALTFGPVPSRRLGRSLGINNIPPKVCSYSCVYCQVGRTRHRETEPRIFYQPDDILRQVRDRIAALRNAGKELDYLTFVPDGEPTLDIQLGRSIALLKSLKLKIAVITNSSMLLRADVRHRLMGAELVSVKVDAVDETIWQRVNRPHKSLQLEGILRGVKKFSEEYRGCLVTETMLVKGINDTEASLKEVADFIATLAPQRAYVAIPTRPPAEHGVSPPDGEKILAAHETLTRKIPRTELLIQYEGDDFVAAGNIRDELIGIASVHPLREEAVEKLLKDANVGHEVIDALIKEKKIIVTEYRGKKFYLRNVRQPEHDTGTASA